MDAKLENLWKTLDTINAWIRFADTKAGGVLALVGIIASIMLSVLAKEGSNISSQYPMFFLLIVLGILSGCGAIFFAILCLIPTLNVGESTALIYFIHIAQKFETPTSYRQAIDKGFTDEQILSQIADQIWANSKVAWKKYRAVTWALRFLTLTIFITVVSIIITII